METRQYQADASEWLVNQICDCAVVSPAGSGKTIIAAMALKKLAEGRDDRLRIGWVANTKEQCLQANDALHCCGVNDNNAAIQIECAAAEADWSWCDVLVVDEAHHLCTAPSWKKQVGTCLGIVWGFTATPPVDDEMAEAAWETTFPEVFTVSRDNISDKLAPAEVRLLKDDANQNLMDDIEDRIDAAIMKECNRRRHWWKGSEQEMWGQVAWQKCSEIGIVQNEARNQTAINIARSHADESVLILVGQIEHGQELCKKIPKSEMCFSKMGAKKRRDVIARFKSGELKCMIATSLADEGFDCPIASVLILVSGGRSEARTVQRTGRVLRKHPGKDVAVIYDFTDDWHPLAAKHSRVRQGIYAKLKYKTAL